MEQLRPVNLREPLRKDIHVQWPNLVVIRLRPVDRRHALLPFGDACSLEVSLRGRNALVACICLDRPQINMANDRSDIGPAELMQLPFLAFEVARTAMFAMTTAKAVQIREALEKPNHLLNRLASAHANNERLNGVVQLPLPQFFEQVVGNGNVALRVVLYLKPVLGLAAHQDGLVRKVDVGEVGVHHFAATQATLQHQQRGNPQIPLHKRKVSRVLLRRVRGDFNLLILRRRGKILRSTPPAHSQAQVEMKYEKIERALWCVIK